MGTAPGHPAEPLLFGVGNADGTGDGIMVAGDVEALAHEYCKQGLPVTFDEYTGLPHTEAAAPLRSRRDDVPGEPVRRAARQQRMLLDRTRHLDRPTALARRIENSRQPHVTAAVRAALSS